jgi:tRNA(His) 5'-end guanylyltransferase
MNSLGDRMKRYEQVSKGFLTPKMPVIIRVDGKAFHTFTRRFPKPFSKGLMEAMDDAAFTTALQMQGCVAFYVQSDEVTFLLTDWENHETQGWFNYNHQKIVSLSAAYMSVNFNKMIQCVTSENAVFDSRAFNVPREDVVNCFLWRMKDWHRNSIQMYARSVFSHKELHKKTLTDIHDMLFEHGKNWATDLTPREKNGSLFLRQDTGGFARCEAFLGDKPTYVTVNDILKDYLE